MSEPDLSLEPLQPHHAGDLVRLAREVFDVDWTEAFVRWKYFENPTGPAFAGGIKSDDGLGASFSNLPVRFKLGDRVVTVAQAVDAMVVTPLRRRGAFLKIAQQTYRQMDEAQIAFTYVFPSEAAAAGFVRKLDYRTIGYVPRYVKVLDAGQAAQAAGKRGVTGWPYRLTLEATRRLPSARSPEPDPTLKLSAITAFDERFDQLWRQTAESFSIAAVRDSAYLNWRYARNPLRHYQVLIAERDKQLLGFLVLGKLAVVGVVLEWLVVPEETSTGQALLAEATRWAREQHLAMLYCWMLPHQNFYTQLLEQSGFAHRPQKWMPGLFRSNTHFIVRAIPNSVHSPDPYQLSNWYVSLGDHDYY